MYLYIKFHSRNSIRLPFHHKSVAPKLLSSTCLLLFDFSDPAHVPLCQGSGSWYERGSTPFWERALLCHRWLHHDCVQGDQGHWHIAPQVCPSFFPCCKDIDELFHMFNSGLQILKARHSLKKRWHHSSGDCSGNLCCMWWCHAAATECAETL